MRGLSSLPQLSDYVRAYNRLQSGQSVDFQEITLYSQWSRLDPRLAEILTGYLDEHWSGLPMGATIQALTQHPWPRALCVLLRFVHLSMLDSSSAKILKHFIDAIEERFPIDSYQLFFIPLQKPNRVIQKQEVEWRIGPYLQSGFIGSQSLLVKMKAPTNRTLLRKVDRGKILAELFSKQKIVTVNDYRKACKNLISVRQAQRDLVELKGELRAKGYTRGRQYIVR